MKRALVILLWLVCPVLSVAAEEVEPAGPRFRVELPRVVLDGVPLAAGQISALTAAGDVDATYTGPPRIEGLRFVGRNAETGAEEEIPVPAFKAGVLLLEADRAAGRTVYVTEDVVRIVQTPGATEFSQAVSRVNGWLCLVPIVLAIALCIWLKNVFVALFVGVWSGAVLLTESHYDFFTGFLRTLDTHVLHEVVQPGSTSYPHMLTILFTSSLGAMVGVLTRGGGTQALVGRFEHYARTRERGQLATWMMGLLVFFDDYANALLVGGTMRPTTDRLRISREKLAFLIDSTAAPVAGLALVSTWVGFEVSQIDEAFRTLKVEGADAFNVFLLTFPFRFYPFNLLFFVWLIAYTGRDFGPMRKAEVRAVTLGQVVHPDSAAPGLRPDEKAPEIDRPLMRNAVIPLVCLILLLVIGLWQNGLQNLEEGQAATLINVLGSADPYWVLFIASFVSSIVAVGCTTATGVLTLNQSVEAWIDGAKTMSMAVLILVLAWSIGTICDADNLNTAGYLVEMTPEMSVNWMPLITFLIAAVISFATGSSFATMGLLIPLSMSVTWGMLIGPDGGGAEPHHQVLLATIGAVLGGAIFGDHCSPISDTTVLASAASGCDHLDHVATQLPYALTVAGVSVLLGYLPMAFGFTSAYLLVPLGLGVLYGVVRWVGKRVDE